MRSGFLPWRSLLRIFLIFLGASLIPSAIRIRIRFWKGRGLHVFDLDFIRLKGWASTTYPRIHILEAMHETASTTIGSMQGLLMNDECRKKEKGEPASLLAPLLGWFTLSMPSFQPSFQQYSRCRCVERTSLP